MADKTPFRARWPFTCAADCGRAGNTGDFLRWTRTRPARYYHLACWPGTEPAADPEPAPEPTSPLTMATPEPEPAPRAVSPAPAAGSAAGALIDALVSEVVARLEPVSESTVRALVDDAVQAATGSRITVSRPGAPDVTLDKAHAKFATLLYLVTRPQHVYLYGPHGTGKSFAASQVAGALGRSYGYISLTPQTPESRLLGFVDAHGNYQATPFFRAYTEGHVFCIDELDNSSPALLTTLNGALENGHCAFPHGVFPRHPDFVLIGTGNTAGRGANPAYPERRPFDRAFADRFAYLSWPVDETLERTIALSICEGAGSWIDWVQAFRRWATANLPQWAPSPRSTFQLAAYYRDGEISRDDALDASTFRGADSDTRDKVTSNFPLPRWSR